ncbi:MAG: hypothetical protein HRT47_11510 [Candidatus Caenarcaniphilales bacterium]|nr:hypothetical protein [Candidatus Caenarcaniphilales bacterium]
MYIGIINQFLPSLIENMGRFKNKSSGILETSKHHLSSNIQMLHRVITQNSNAILGQIVDILDSQQKEHNNKFVNIFSTFITEVNKDELSLSKLGEGNQSIIGFCIDHGNEEYFVGMKPHFNEKGQIELSVGKLSRTLSTKDQENNTNSRSNWKITSMNLNGDFNDIPEFIAARNKMLQIYPA